MPKSAIQIEGDEHVDYKVQKLRTKVEMDEKHKRDVRLYT